MLVRFPTRLRRQAVTFNLTGQSLEARQGLSGATTVVPGFGAIWRATIAFVIKGAAAHREYRAFLAQMEGRLGRTPVPVYAKYRPVDQHGHDVGFCRAGDIAGAGVWDHFAFTGDPIMSAALIAPAALRATRIVVGYTNTTGLRPGDYFSVRDQLHRVQYSWADAAGENLQFQPPLRAALPVGEVLEIQAPRCLMMLDGEAEGAFDQALDVLPTITLNMTEVI